jgi:DNA polymerase III gamma/tau subunit
VVRDLLVLSVDPSRIDDPEISAESERDRLKQLAARFSREDLMRSFDVLSRAEGEIRGAAQPRYHLEMALLRWMHLRKLVPLTDLLDGMAGKTLPAASSSIVDRPASVVQRPASGVQRPSPIVQRPAAAPPKPSPPAEERRSTMDDRRSTTDDGRSAKPAASGGEREAFLEEIKRSKVFLYNTVVAQAHKIDFGPDRVTFTFLPAHRTLREQLEQNRPWLESVAGTITGRKMPVVAAQQDAPANAPVVLSGVGAGTAPARPVDLKATAMTDAAVQAMLDVFPAEIEDVEEI